MFSMTIGLTSFTYGPLEVPYAAVVGAGVAIQQRRSGIYKTLFVAYLLPGAAKPRKLAFRLERGPAGDLFAQSFQSHVADRWKGEADLFAMNKLLGFSNKLAFTIVGAIVVVTVVSVVGWAVSLKQTSAPTPRTDTTTRAPRTAR